MLSRGHTQRPTFPGRGPQPFRHWGLVSWKTIFSRGWVGGVVLGWFNCIILIVHFIFIIITSAPPQIIRHQIPELGAPALWGSPWRLGVYRIRDVNRIMTAPESALSLLTPCWGLGAWGCFICFFVFNVCRRSGLPSWSVIVPPLLRITEVDNGK